MGGSETLNLVEGYKNVNAAGRRDKILKVGAKVCGQRESKTFIH